MFFLTMEPLWLSGIIIIGLITLVGVLGPIIVRRNVGLENLLINNEVAGFKFSAVGVFYAVLLAFAVILVWQRVNDAETVVVREAGAAETIYRLAAGIGDGEGAKLQDEVTAYLQTVMAGDWPAMQRGGESPDVSAAVNRLYATVFALHPGDAERGALFAEILHQLDRLTEARHARLALAATGVPAILWVTLFLGAAVTVGFTFFFGTRNLRTQVLMTALLALLIATQLWIIVAIDRPFTGAIGIRPRALAAVMHEHMSPLPTP